MMFRILASLGVLAVLAALAFVTNNSTESATVPAAPSTLTPDDNAMKGLKIN